VKIQKICRANSRIGKKWGSWCALNNVSIHSMSSIFTKFEQGKNKNGEKSEKINNE
jgi:hypothetical protein